MAHLRNGPPQEPFCLWPGPFPPRRPVPILPAKSTQFSLGICDRSSPTGHWGTLNMLAYVMVGTNDLKRSAKFYAAALAPLDLVRTGDGDRYFGYGPKSAPQDAQFFVTKPYDQKPATVRQRHDDLSGSEISEGGR